METTKVRNIIFDTDIGDDCDDAGALALLHRLCGKGEVNLLAVTACYASPYVAGCIDAINTYYGRKVPVGINYKNKMENIGIQGDRGVYTDAICREFPNRFPAENYGTLLTPPDTLAVLRQSLAEAEEDSVTLVITGSLASAARLVQSQPDEISPLTGSELIRQKVNRTVIMGGRFYGTWPMPIILEDDSIVTWEWNIHLDISAAQTVCNLWPGKLIFSSYEIGLWCVSMKEYVEKAPKDDPVRRAYEVHGSRKGRSSWDHTAILEAVRPEQYWYYHPWGKITVDDEGITTWNPQEDGMHTYLIPKYDYDMVCQTIDDLVYTGVI